MEEIHFMFIINHHAPRLMLTMTDTTVQMNCRCLQISELELELVHCVEVIHKEKKNPLHLATIGKHVTCWTIRALSLSYRKNHSQLHT